MSTASSAEQLALRGLLLVVVEVQNIVRDVHREPWRRVEDVQTLIESAPTAELVQLARAALENPLQVVAPAAPPRQVFYGIVTQYDCSERYRERHLQRRRDAGDEIPDGPIIFEQYLVDATRDRGKLEEKAATMRDYGWVRVAEIHVDIPTTPAAIPAAAASIHV